MDPYTQPIAFDSSQLIQTNYGRDVLAHTIKTAAGYCYLVQLRDEEINRFELLQYGYSVRGSTVSLIVLIRTVSWTSSLIEALTNVS